MKKFYLCIAALCLVFLGLNPTAAHAASNSLSVATVQANTANVYALPNSGSQVVHILNKGEEYPLLTSSAGDATSPVTHTVDSGDTLWIIANQYGVSIQEINSCNKLKTTSIYPGQKIAIPQHMTIYTVKSGDTLWKVSQQYNVNVNDVVKANNLRSTQLSPGQKIKIPDYYYQIQLLNGEKGWIKKSCIQIKNEKRMMMGWNYGGTTDTYIGQNRSPNLKVVSPSWFVLDSQRVLSASIDARYVSAAHAQGKKVWPLLANRFDPVLTDVIIGNPQKRQQLVTALRDSLVKSKSDGINVDFENIDMKDKQNFVLFISELKQALQPYKILVSVDVTRENGDPFWSGSYDRHQLGMIADYIIMMGYDEHWDGDPTPGSVASLSWTAQGIQLLMKDVPAQKIMLAVPFYTREWITNQSTNKVTSYDRTMAEAEKIIANKGLHKVWDDKACQNYVEYTANGQKHQIWLEDNQSMQLRQNIVNQYHLGGIAAWYIGAETPAIWTTFDLYR
ncbi:LysM peptidoglycan-binding domain-containing protein [Aneurinibacillus sp. Ricciae_BoGa-3]|uniref:LysM peptidoglycan-binding domain-containing protein n=1 Tax=Aneurinibacillus sp. Ricciae_BoGa-3 TaxID=3022697 RepID=UPI0023419613|nr:LysM peptidoglycan-binding domain-containing protein [Aneurinibacillus sp. Ricciae_BoGa-3]WCK55673.1 LysM peptidoglycan-binding domain-containing protein [Aneurinibacillus sp. Ricciae_BoGa-3]